MCHDTLLTPCLLLFYYSEGISSNASGSLIIKPCTQAEIDFYESAKDHPLFQAHMPTFIGSLTQNEDQEAVKPLLGVAQTTQFAPDGSSAGVIDPTPELAKRTSWTPSGGKKLATGLAIVLENVAAGFKHPNVLDVKLGARLWDDDAPTAKRRKLDEVAQRTTSGSLGFRVAGMKVWCGRPAEKESDIAADQEGENGEKEPNVVWKSGYKSYTKLYGQSFSKDNVVDAFTTYLGGVRVDETTGKTVLKRKHAQLLAKRFLRELESIQYALENEESRMYSASVLMVYEGDEDAWEAGLQEEEKEKDRQPDGDDEEENEDEDEDDDEQIPQKVHEVRLIDFAHASWTPGQGPDENALMGVRSLIRILRSLVE